MKLDSGRWRGVLEAVLGRIEAELYRAQAYVRGNQAYLLAKSRLWLGRVLFWLCGIAVGLAAVVFALASDKAAHFFAQMAQLYPWLPFLVTPLAAMGLLWVTRTYFEGAQGSGIPQVIAEMKHPAGVVWRPLVSLRIAVGKDRKSVV